MSLLLNWLESLSEETSISDACLRSVSPLCTCSSCVDFCPENALVIEDEKIKLVETTCTNCGSCVAVCSVQAIKGHSPKRRVMDKTLIIDQLPLPSRNELLFFYHKGVNTIAVLIEDMQREKLLDEIRKVNSLLEQMNLAPLKEVFTIELTAREDSVKYTRRDLFTKFTDRGKKTVLLSMTPAKWRTNEKVFNLTSYFDGWSFYRITLEQERCTVCEICFQMCPSSVFNIEDEALIIHDKLCSGCGLCLDVCHDQAISLSLEPHPSSPEILNLVQNQCNTCGQSFNSWDVQGECHLCSAKKKHNLLSFL